jgi:hypothetical protein
MQQRPLVLSQSYHKFSHRMHRRPSPRFPPSSDPRPLFLNLSFGAVQNPQSQSHPAGIDVASFRAGILRSGRSASLCGSVCRIFETALDNHSSQRFGSEVRRRKYLLQTTDVSPEIWIQLLAPGMREAEKLSKKKHKEKEQSMGTGNQSNSPSF